jgi:excisionase family DNA binding protein
MPDSFLTTEQAAQVLNVNLKTVARLCREGKLGFSKPGRKYLIPQESLDAYLKIVR